MNPHRLTRIATLLAASLLTASCGTIDPTAFTRHEIEERVVQDEKAMYADQEPITSPITFQEAAARALKYNLDYRLKLMENSLSKNLYDVSKYEMLPRLVAGAGYISRNNDSGGTSVSIETETTQRMWAPRVSGLPTVLTTSRRRSASSSCSMLLSG